MRLGLARLCLPALALAAVAGLLLDGGPAAGQQQGQPPGGGKGVPVTVATAKRQDVPVWLDGIGNVQAYNTVTIRSRVDGELMKVAFTEGQTVKAGDLLAQIDPRPFQAALDQAKAKKAQDEAQLQNAQRDLDRSTDLAQRGFAPRQTLDQQRAQVDQFTAAVQGDDAAIESAQVQLGYATITAPITGRTGMRLVDQGNIVHAERPERSRDHQPGAADLGRLHPAGAGAAGASTASSPRASSPSSRPTATASRSSTAAS